MAEHVIKKRENTRKQGANIKQPQQRQLADLDDELLIPGIAEKILDVQQTYGNRYVQRLAEGNGNTLLNKDIIHRIERQKGSGASLYPGAIPEMEAVFKHDFSDVRMHTDSEADSLSKTLEAEAFTVGQDIFFRKGAYSPETESGKRLLKHELTHTIQQAQSDVSEPLEISQPGELAEVEAHNAEQAGPLSTSRSFATALIMRRSPTLRPNPFQTTKPNPFQLKPNPFQSTEESGEETAEATNEPTEPQEERRGPVQAMWQEAVVRRYQEAREVLTNGRGNLRARAGESITILSDVNQTIRSLYDRYRDNVEIHGELQFLSQTVAASAAHIRPYAGMQASIEEIQEAMRALDDDFIETGNKL